MRIGILTYGRVANFGANLQSASTYKYLEKQGHTPIYIYYLPKDFYDRIEENRKKNPQIQAHYDFFDSVVRNQTLLCHTTDDINKEIRRNEIEAIIIGSDAVLQHHPLISRIALRKNIFPFRIVPVTSDRLFPNVFWGYGISGNIKKALMSVSCQNSEYKYFSYSTKTKMNEAISHFDYISVRDSWTQKMLYHINSKIKVPITPDPVFAFNYNMEEFIPAKKDILSRYGLPKKYVLISMFGQTVSPLALNSIKNLFAERGISCVALPMPDEGVSFVHDFDFVIPSPLSPIDWYALIKYSCGYIGENMHPIVCCLHNAVPCYSIDNWGATNFWGKPKQNGSSKVEDIMRIFKVEKFRSTSIKGYSDVTPSQIVDAIIKFPTTEVSLMSKKYFQLYLDMMISIFDTFKI